MSVRLREQIVEIIVNSAMAKALGDKWIKKHKGNLFGMNVWNSAIDKLADQILALIGKCATPTFSGEKRFGDCCKKCGLELGICNCATEQKCICNTCTLFNTEYCVNCKINQPPEQKECRLNI
jgi:hypothetical protein